ncbi:MAG: TolC family outer membrane protein [Pseudomonadaceae bacterium]|nr:TolC family outer membrane protein [Pseudomonadaceae bacterium]
MNTRTAALLGLVISAANAQSALALSMQEAMAKAIATHPEGLAAEKNQAAIGHQIDIAKGGYLPTVDLTAGTGWENSTNPSTRFRAGRGPGDKPSRDLWRNESRLTVRQMIWDAHQTKYRVAQQTSRFESAAFNVADVKNQLALRAAESYLNVLRTAELVALSEQNLAKHNEYVGKIADRKAGGRAAGADIKQAESRRELAEANLIAAKGQLREAEADYLEVVGEMPNAPVKDATPFGVLPADTASAIARAMDNSPVIANAKANIKAANAELAEAACPFCPRLEAEGGISRNHNLDGVQGVNHDMTAMLYLRQNLYNGGRDVAQRKERLERVSEATDMLEGQRRLVEQAVIKAMARMDSAKNRLTPLTNSVEAVTSTRDAYQTQFNLGQRSLLDLLDSEVELFNAKAALINGKYDLDAAAYAVLANMGELVVSDHSMVVAAN